MRGGGTVAKKRREKQWKDYSVGDLTKILKKGINVLAKKVEEKTN